MKFSPLWPYINDVDQRAGDHAEFLPLLSVSQHFGVRRHAEISDKPARADDLGIYKTAAIGDVILNRMSATKGAVGVASEPGLVSPDYAVLRPSKGISSQYVYYLLKSSWGLSQISMRLRGIGNENAANVRTQRVSIHDFLRIRWPLPDKERQSLIADYLDRETAEIDASIAELSHFIKLTEERRNATRIKLFSPPYTENLTPIKRVAQLVGGSGFPLAQQGLTNEELPFYKVGSLSSAEDGTLTMAADSISRSTARSLGAEVLPPGSVVMAKIGAALFLRRNALLTKPGCIDNNMLGLIPTSEIDGRYLQEVLLTLDLTPIANPGAVPSLNMRWFRETKIEAPSLETQRKVMRRFSEVDSAARLALVDATKAIQLAQERRSALISAAVTGQIDVAAQGMSAAEQLQDELEVHP